MVDDNILWFDVPMHDSQRVSVVQPFQDLVDIQFAVSWHYVLKDKTVLSRVNVLKD